MSQITKDTLGYKQNNPGNIRNSGDVFNGEVISSNSFKSFSRMMYGYRAIAKLFFTYFNRGANTLTKLITTYAPPNENNTANYIAIVSKATGINPNTVLTEKDFKEGLFSEPKVKKILRAISQQEISYVNESELTKGYNDFLKQL